MKNRTKNIGQKTRNRKLFWLLCSLSFVLCSSGFASEAKWQDTLAKIPVQQGGRVKPFETFAREAVLYVTGRPAWNKQPATQTVWEWMAVPEKWIDQSLIYVSAPQVRSEFGLKLINKRVSSEVVLSDKVFGEAVQDAIHRREKKESLTFVDKKRIEVYERAVFLSQLSGGVLPGWIPEPQNPHAAWLRFADFAAEPAEWMRALPPAELEAFQQSAAAFAGIFKQESVLAADQLKAAQNFRASVDAVWSKLGVSIDRRLLDQEIFYNRLHAFGRGSKLYLIAALFFLAANFVRARGEKNKGYLLGAGFVAYGVALLLHVAGFYLRCVISGRAPVTNMYESVVWVSLATAIFSLPIYFYLRQISVLAIAAFVAAVGLLIAESFPAVLDPAISPLVPVLRSNLWLTVHVLTITMSYGAFALAWGLGHAVVFGYAFKSKKKVGKREWLEPLSLAVYRALQIGVVLLAAGTVLGGVWANYSWGRFWGWDPKETWALIALLGYLVVLHGRFIGWYGAFGIAMGAVIAFMGVIMAWYGVNFVLAAGLHSYGFGGGGYPYVAAVVLVDLLVVGLLAFKYKKLRLC